MWASLPSNLPGAAGVAAVRGPRELRIPRPQKSPEWDVHLLSPVRPVCDTLVLTSALPASGLQAGARGCVQASSGLRELVPQTDLVKLFRKPACFVVG